MLKALYNSRLLDRGWGFSSVPRLPGWSFQLLTSGGSLPPPQVPRSFGAGDLRLPPLISTEKTAPSDSAELFAGHESLPKNPTLFRVRIGKGELKQ